MTKEIIPIIQWISENLHKTSSLWNSFIHTGHIPDIPENTAKSIIYVTGSLPRMKEAHTVFTEIVEENELTILTHSDIEQSERTVVSTHPLLDWITICYIPLSKLQDYPVEHLVAFTNGRPEKWIRQLLNAQKVSGLVGWTNQILDEWEVSWSSSYEAFSIQLLTQDNWMYKKPSSVQLRTTLTMSEKQKSSLQQVLSLENPALYWQNSLDSIATELLETLWEQENFKIRDFSPILVRLVDDYLTNIHDISTHEYAIEEIEKIFNEWIGGRNNVNKIRS